MSLPDALDETRDDERRKAARALLGKPLLTPRDPEFALVRRHAGHLGEFFAREAGWSLHTDPGVARLRKTPGRLTDGTRPAVGKNKQPFGRRRYVLTCLALAALERAESQVTLGWLVDRVVAFAADDSITNSGITFTLTSRDERGDLVAVSQLLLSLGVLVKVAGDEQAFMNDTGDALFDVDRRVLSVLLATRRGPSMITETAGRLEAITEEPLPDTDEGRNRAIRQLIARRLLDDPVLYYSELTEEQRYYLDRTRVPLLRRLAEATGFIAEVRAEGIALLDPTREATDFGMPDEGTEGHATLLLAEYCSGKLRDGVTTIKLEQAEARMRALVDEHRSHWRKSATEPGAERELTRLALHRLAALGLVELRGDLVEPLPALARFAYAAPEITGKSRR